MSEKRYSYKLTDSFVEKCVKALAFYDTVDEISRRDDETEEEAKERLNQRIGYLKTQYRLHFIQNS